MIGFAVKISFPHQVLNGMGWARMRQFASSRQFACVALALAASLVPRDLLAVDPAAPFQIVKQGQPLPAGRLLSVGPTALAKKAGVTGDDLKWDACRLRVKDRKQFLVLAEVVLVRVPAESRFRGH
jgi:hypothetical protein